MSERYNAFEVVQELEYQLCRYTGSPYCAVVNSCTNAIGIVLEYEMARLEASGIRKGVDRPCKIIPKFTYIGVPMQIKRAGFEVLFREEDWEGEYLIDGNSATRIYDSARRFRKDMYGHEDLMGANKYKCLSFHRTKILGHSQGGAVIHNDKKFQRYAEMMRFDGRTPGDLAQNDNPTVLGRHCYMDPEVAAALLHKLMYTHDYNADLPKSAYPDLSQLEIFK